MTIASCCLQQSILGELLPTWKSSVLLIGPEKELLQDYLTRLPRRASLETPAFLSTSFPGWFPSIPHLSSGGASLGEAALPVRGWTRR
jgi:hypothetical protein